jgi:16S rRNA processing protein RimM
MSTKKSNLIDVGRITTVHGIQGWVKVRSHTAPIENLLQYQPWWLKTRHGVKAVEIDAGQVHGQGLIVHIKGVDDRDLARDYCQVDVAVERNQLPELDADEFYWHQLEGLKVVSNYEGQVSTLGVVVRMMETGANDVLVIKGDDGSIDQKERLVPYLPDQVIKSIDLDAQLITVEWDPEF